MRSAWLVCLVLAACGNDSAPRKAAELSVEQALAREDTSLEAHADEPGSTAFMFVYRRPGTASVVVPAGTLLRARDPHVQLQMLAADVRFAVTGGSLPQIASDKAETYCVQRFYDLPAPRVPLTIHVDVVGGGGGFELNAVRRLVQCFAEKHAHVPFEVRQLAVWMVSEEFLDLTREEVIDKFRQAKGSDIHRRATELLSSQGREILRERWPGLTEDELQAHLQRYRAKHLPAFVEKLIQNEIDRDWEQARPLLDACGHDTSTSRFYASGS